MPLVRRSGGGSSKKLNSLLLVWRGRRWLIVGAVGIFVTAAMFLIEGIGELTAEETADTAKAVLVVGGIVWILVALSLLGLAVAVFMERWRSVRRARGGAAS